jgi:transketolase
MLASKRRVFVLLSDAECNEGAVWEAAMFAKHHQLANLTAIVDMNGQQALGHTKDVLDLESMTDKWRAFGWDVHDIDGHDSEGLTQTIAALDHSSGPPHVLLARTVFGKGVSYMEGLVRWHYMPMSDDEFVQALAEIDAP